MDQDNTSTMLFYILITVCFLSGALNLRALIIDLISKHRKAAEKSRLIADIQAKETKIVMLEAKIIYLETQNRYDTGSNYRNSE